MARQNTNAVSQPGLQARIPAVLELAALDDLGPKARFALTHAPLATLAYAIVDQVLKRNELIEIENEQRAAEGLPLRPYIDPKDPRLDALFAQQIVADQVGLLARERSIEDARAGVIPMRGRQSPKSLREQRRAERASRRMMR
jgi:hypothetical protein